MEKIVLPDIKDFNKLEVYMQNGGFSGGKKSVRPDYRRCY